MKGWIILTRNIQCCHKFSFNMKLVFETHLKYLWNQMHLLPTKWMNLEFHKLDHLYFSGRVFFPEVKFTFIHEFFNSTTSSSFWSMPLELGGGGYNPPRFLQIIKHCFNEEDRVCPPHFFSDPDFQTFLRPYWAWPRWEMAFGIAGIRDKWGQSSSRCRSRSTGFDFSSEILAKKWKNFL